MEYLNKTLEKRRKDIQDLNKEISQARIHLRDFIVRYFSDLIRQVSGTSLETFNDFVIREIGDKGINIETKVQNEFERQTQGISNEIAKIETGFNADMSSFEKHAGTFGKIGIDLLEQSGFINATNIKLARDGIVAVARFTGIDLALKFKPWGAVNLASNINKALPLIGLAFEAWDSWKESQKIEKLEKTKEKMKSDFDNQKKKSWISSTMKPDSNKHVSQWRWNWKNAFKHAKKALKKRKSALKDWKNGFKLAKILSRAKIS
ncbi:hypothetical protein HMPREF1451_00535 [Helicobacter pylori HP260BFii]|uniref:Dynamin-like helical domain-containing protein n=1 Tax=Helicobacter pylori GAM260BSi TaxID=1159046 RepID=M3PIW0_HELPX|nr:hypothetical protein HMPREF1418_00383 [Helicobacter pylori GAM260BSi]EMH69043.1 hypothetical protein HMPREF1451_00535 [Helicobacter pylori HP260BFii]